MSSIIPHIMVCPRCNRYTLKQKCQKCGSLTRDPKPARYSPEDRYGKYRRMAKKEISFGGEIHG